VDLLDYRLADRISCLADAAGRLDARDGGDQARAGDQKLVGISRVRSFSITLGRPKGQRAATRNGRGPRPSCRATAS